MGLLKYGKDLPRNVQKQIIRKYGYIDLNARYYNRGDNQGWTIYNEKLDAQRISRKGKEYSISGNKAHFGDTRKRKGV